MELERGRIMDALWLLVVCGTVALVVLVGWKGWTFSRYRCKECGKRVSEREYERNEGCCYSCYWDEDGLGWKKPISSPSGARAAHYGTLPTRTVCGMNSTSSICIRLARNARDPYLMNLGLKQGHRFVQIVGRSCGSSAKHVRQK